MYKQYASALFDAIKNKNMPTSVKVLMGLGIGYVLSPIDIIPEMAIPGIGVVDDTILAAVLIAVGGKIIWDKRLSEKEERERRQMYDDENIIDM